MTKKFHTDWFKISLFREPETAIRLDIKFRWGLTKVTSFWICFFFNNNTKGNNNKNNNIKKMTDDRYIDR